MAIEFKNNQGYMWLDAWVMAFIIQLSTYQFCKKHLSRNPSVANTLFDPTGRQFDQMTQAARSAVANIAEGSARHQTSRETEMKLFDVARASLHELINDYQFFLLTQGELPWIRTSQEALTVNSITLEKAHYSDDWLHESSLHIMNQKCRFDAWINHPDGKVAANALLLLCLRCEMMLEKLMQRQLDSFKQEGGFTENMTKERLDTRIQQQKDAPMCPKCGAPMIKQVAKKGINAGKEFWSCSNYRATGCRGAMSLEEAEKRQENTKR